MADGRRQTVSGSVRLFGGQRRRAVVPRGRSDRGHQRTHRGRQLDGRSSRGHEQARDVPRLFRSHATRLVIDERVENEQFSFGGVIVVHTHTEHNIRLELRSSRFLSRSKRKPR